MRGQPFQDIFEHFIRESRSGMPDVAQLASVIDKIFSRPRGFGNASDHSLLLHMRLDLEPGFGASSRLVGIRLRFMNQIWSRCSANFRLLRAFHDVQCWSILQIVKPSIFSSHFPFTSIGQVTQHEGAYEWKFL
jgi:hypothetical protein